MTAMKSTINAIREAGLRNKVKIMIGGAPVSQNFSDKQELMVKVITQMVR
jgi:5-methyltetrahydrofolate--homocysteine methyltransferase